MNSKSEPLVSVVITSYNRPDLVGRAVGSASKQDYDNLEIIVVDDNSDRFELIKSKVEGNIVGREVKIIHHTSNRGLASSRNTGIKNANGDLVSFLDDDDEWVPTKVGRQVELMRKKSFQDEVVYCGAKKLRESSDEEITKMNPIMRGDVRQNIKKGRFQTISSSNLIKKEEVTSIGGFDEDLESHIDYDIWMKMARSGFSADYVDDYLVNVYEGQNQMTRRYRERVFSTKKFINKWRPFLREVMGTKKSEEFISHLGVSVISRQSAVAITSGDLFYGIKCLLYLYSKDLVKLSNLNVGVAAFLGSIKQIILSKKS